MLGYVLVWTFIVVISCHLTSRFTSNILSTCDHLGLGETPLLGTSPPALARSTNHHLMWNTWPQYYLTRLCFLTHLDLDLDIGLGFVDEEETDIWKGLDWEPGMLDIGLGLLCLLLLACAYSSPAVFLWAPYFWQGDPPPSLVTQPSCHSAWTLCCFSTHMLSHFYPSASWP